MRVLVTGGGGRVGLVVTELMLREGYDVRAIGRRVDVQIQGAEYVACDITQYDKLYRQMQGCEGVVHLAAIPSPHPAPGQEVFRVNALGTYNVFEAASRLGIGCVVQASSINAFGCYYSTQHTAPNYLPIDEAHPTYTTDPYSFSKGVVEDIGDYYWRRDGISSVALRLPGVWSPSYVEDPERLERVRADWAALDRFVSQPQDVWRARLAEAQRWASEFRRGRPFEYGSPQDHSPVRPTADDEILHRMVTHDRFDFWTAIDERDAAQAVVRGLEASYQGSYVLFVNDCYNLLGYDAQALARLFYPETPVWRSSLVGPVSLVSIERARALIGYEPQYHVCPGGQL